MKSTYDYLIVGQGLAGTLLAHFLLQAKKTVLLVDDHHKGAASKVAAGIINPITGRRYVKSWRIDDLLPFARQIYRQLEQQLNISFYHPNHVIRSLFNRREENDWQLRLGQEGYQKYMLAKADLGSYAEHTLPAFSYGEVQNAAQVDLGKLVSTYADHFLEQDQLIREPFDFSALAVHQHEVHYKGYTARQLIFCEGHQAAQNPFFNYLPFGGAKGEVLIIRIPDAQFEKMLKHRVFIVPLEGNRYWVGSSYEWDYQDDQPTSAGRAFLEERLRDMLSVPFEVVAHLAAIRPTVKDRRPFLGQHPEFASLFIFNGLGTKGASLGPFWAKHMADHLVSGNPIDSAVNISRFM